MKVFLRLQIKCLIPEMITHTQLFKKDCSNKFLRTMHGFGTEVSLSKQCGQCYYWKLYYVKGSNSLAKSRIDN